MHTQCRFQIPNSISNNEGDDEATSIIMWIMQILLATLAIKATFILAVPVSSATAQSSSKDPSEDQHEGCKFILNIYKIPRGAADENGYNIVDKICSMILANAQPDNERTMLQSRDSTIYIKKPLDVEKPSSQPLYEQQLAVWPSDIEDIVDIVQQQQFGSDQEVLSPEEEAVLASSGPPESHVIPLYEDQLVIFPEQHFEEDNLNNDAVEDDDYVDDDDDDDEGIVIDTSLDLWPDINKPTVAPAVPQVQVLEKFHVVHPNRTTEYKLVLSNGMVNYKKIYEKRVQGDVIMVQEGYDSVPVNAQRNEYQTQYYIADEHGTNVYKIEYSHQRPVLPKYLSYQQQIAAADKKPKP